ncbi:ribonuclease P protein component [Longirhabdus pacifica]|uniref:ribonuclease P protein component n=1 Tax=Longirhabdus pacifica TaxID=2305227 RepID=UPI001009233A|nr:ribonuclease P protein component [Longirhabdus pacifica]
MEKKYRLAKNEQFKRIYRNGQSMANHQFVVYSKPSKGTEHFRVGVVVSKKIGNAVVRNRMRRVMKEILRHHKHDIISNVDIIVLARKATLNMNYKQLESSMKHVLRKAGLISKKQR